MHTSPSPSLPWTVRIVSALVPLCGLFFAPGGARQSPVRGDYIIAYALPGAAK